MMTANIHWKSAFFFFSALLLACGVQAGGRELDDVMEDLEDQVKIVAKTFEDKSQNQSNSDRSLSIRKLSLESMSMLPEDFEKLNAAELRLNSTIYQKFCLELAATAAEMEIAFLNGDNKSIQGALAKLDDLRKRGHKLFK